MADRGVLARLSDDELGAALRGLATALAVPAGAAPAATATDPARLARLRIEADSAIRASRRWARWLPTSGGRTRRSLVLALVALVVLAAIAGAIGLGLPGIRIVPAGTGSPVITSPTAGAASPSASVGGAPGAGLGLGRQVDVADMSRSVDFPVTLPADPAVGPPVSAWVLESRLSIVWPSRAALPALREPSIGLILSEFRASLDPGYFEKILNPRTRIEAVTVNGATGWWISGEPHGIVFVRPNGDPAFDSRRIVGDTLIWARADVTYRLESALGREAAIRLAEALR